MKRVQQFFALCIAVILAAALLVACAPADSNPVDTNNYQVFLDSSLLSGANTLAESVVSYTYKQDRPLTTPAETTKTVTLNGESYTLHHVESRITLQNDETYDFDSEDQNITFRYFADNMQLRTIILQNQDMTVFENMTQAEYEAWIRQFVAQYTTENWDEYQPNYQTEYTTSDGTPHKNNEFLDTLPNGAVLSDRVFNYVKYYKTLKTADILSVRFSFDDNFIAIIFNPQWFDAYNVNIDIEQMQTAITDYVKANLWENTTLQDIAFTNGTLVHIDENYLCRWTITTNVLTETGSVVEDSYYVLVDVPDA